MSSQPVPCVTPEEYLKFDRSSELRHEYVFGEIVQMVGGTYEHALIQMNAGGALRDRLPKGPCRVLGPSVRVMLHRDASYTYPDATVVCGKPEFLDKEADTITNPRLIVEVLSPTTRNYDLGDKTRMYWRIPSLTDLLLVEQDKVWIEYWSREPGGKWDQKVASDLGDVLKIASMDCELPVTEIYSGVELLGG
jgi:Uma2 family endonuclease